MVLFMAVGGAGRSSRRAGQSSQAARSASGDISLVKSSFMKNTI